MPTSGPSADGTPHVVMVGLMGSGKTTVGRLVADQLARPFLDSDEYVESRTGHTVREIFETQGEREFRRLEAVALADALGAPEASVIAAAGGVVLAAENRELLKRGETFVVWLCAAPEVLAARVATGHHRPLLRDDPLAVLREMVRDRRGLYEEVADVMVDVGDREPGDVAGVVLDLLEAARAR